MPVLPLVLGLLVQAAPAPTPGPAAGYRPSGTPADLAELDRLPLLRDPGVRSLCLLSCGGTGARPGGAVLADVDGPGILQRLWIAPAAGGRPGQPGRDSEHIRIYIDGQSQPVLDVSLEELAGGRHPAFPRPLVSGGPGGLACVVPVAFRDGCRVELDGGGWRPALVSLVALPGAEGLVSFRARPSAEERRRLDRAVAVWSRPGDFEALGVVEAEPAAYVVEAIERTTLTFALPDGPRTIRSLEVEPGAETAEAWRAARLRLTWEGDDPASAGVDLPLGLAFGQACGPGPDRSIPVGQAGRSWYLRFPMPYRRRAVLQLDTERPLRGTIRLRSVRSVDARAGYFRALAGAGDDFLQERGRGHYVGAFLAVAGPAARAEPWPAGFVRLMIDGRPPYRGPVTADLGSASAWWPGLRRLPEGPAASPVRGSWAGGRSGARPCAAAYRWHLADPVGFAHSIAAGLERGSDADAPPGDRAAVFWYSERPGPGR